MGNSGFDGAKADGGDHANLPHNDGGAGASGNEVQINQSTTIGRSSEAAHSQVWKCLRRPILPSKEYEQLLAEEEGSQPSESIYDFSTLQAW